MLSDEQARELTILFEREAQTLLTLSQTAIRHAVETGNEGFLSDLEAFLAKASKYLTASHEAMKRSGEGQHLDRLFDAA